jgi:hypothetical protein
MEIIGGMQITFVQTRLDKPNPPNSRLEFILSIQRAADNLTSRLSNRMTPVTASRKI